MMRSGEAREREHERCHRETMQDMKDRHEEAMRTAADRHDESMRKHDESMRKHDESMRALEALIERTAPPRVPGEMRTAGLPERPARLLGALHGIEREIEGLAEDLRAGA